jgi:hypothetical protein
MIKKLFSILIAFSLVNCIGTIRDKKNIFKTNEYSFFLLERGVLKDGDVWKEELIHPIEIKQENLLSMLANVKFKRESSIGEVISYIFEEDEIRSIVKDIPSGFKKLTKDNVLLVISRYQPTKSVMSKYVRTSFILFADNQGLNVLFGEIKSDLDKDIANNYFEWTNIEDISLKSTSDSDFIYEEDYFSFRDVQGFPNRRWIVFNLDNLDRFKYNRERPTKTKKPVVTDEEPTRERGIMIKRQ